MTGHKTPIKGWTLNPRTGVLERDKRSMPVNKRIAGSKRKRVVTRAQAIGIAKK